MNKAQGRRSRHNAGYYERYFAKLSQKKAQKKVDREKRIKAAKAKRAANKVNNQ